MEQKMTALAMSFRAYREKVARGQLHELWDAQRVSEWLETAAWGERRVYRFLLSVWDKSENSFDLHDALSVWDDEHRAAFIAWAKDPWWA